MTKRLPRPYQAEAIKFLLATPCAGLFADMGLGKTGAVLLSLIQMKERPVLIVGPIRVIETVWEPESRKWEETTGLTFSLVRGSKPDRVKALETPADIYLVNPELLEEVLLAKDWTGGVLVIDESSMFKNPSTKRFKTLRKHLTKFARRIILTGTPTPNSLMDIWSQVFILDRGQRLETAFYRFKMRYFRQADYMGYKFEPVEGATERVTETVSDIILRIEAKGNLPARETLDNLVEFELPPAARRTYREMERHALVTLNDENVSAANAAAALMKLRQIANGFVYNDLGETEAIHDEKILATQEIVDATSSPVIVVYNFQHELAALRKAFPFGVTLDDWNQDDWDAGKIPLLFLHPASGGHGLNLQYGCHTMIIFSGSFSYEQMAQTKARIDRQGQEFPVVFHFLEARDTVDELVRSVLEAKATTQATVLSLVKEYAHARK
jgi:SNF2 family DNA or RNA helicase